MELNDEFPEIGRKMPYQAPDDFFENVARKTLHGAKMRERKSRHAVYLWRSVAVAASIVALIFIGYFMFQNNIKPEVQVVVQKNKPAEQKVEEKIAIQKLAEVTVVQKAPLKNAVEEIQIENMEEILADLTEEELLQMAAMIKTDPFSEEFEQ